MPCRPIVSGARPLITARSSTPSHPATSTVAEGTLVWPLPGQSSRASNTVLPLTTTVASDPSAGAKVTA